MKKKLVLLSLLALSILLLSSVAVNAMASCHAVSESCMEHGYDPVWTGWGAQTTTCPGGNEQGGAAFHYQCSEGGQVVYETICCASGPPLV